MTQSIKVKNSSQQSTALITHFLTFRLGQEEYAIDIANVQEIRSYQITMTVSNCPAFVTGIIKLADDAALVIDLRLLFNIKSVTYNERALMILLKIQDHLFAMIVDEALDVTPITEQAIKPAAELDALTSRHCIKGLVNYQNRLLILLDVEKLFTEELLLAAKQMKDNY